MKCIWNDITIYQKVRVRWLVSKTDSNKSEQTLIRSLHRGGMFREKTVWLCVVHVVEVLRDLGDPHGCPVHTGHTDCWYVGPAGSWWRLGWCSASVIKTKCGCYWRWVAGLPHKKSHEKTYPEILFNRYLGYTVHYINFLSNLPTLFVCNTALNLVSFVVLFWRFSNEIYRKMIIFSSFSNWSYFKIL